MRFWELVSAYREFAQDLEALLQHDRWREPYWDWYRRWNQLVAEQDRSVLDAVVPPELSREVARSDPRVFAYDETTGVLRLASLQFPSDVKLRMMSGLEVHDEFGAAAIEQVLENGSTKVSDRPIATSADPTD